MWNTARVDVAQSLPHHWAYLCEGGSTIVFSYTGPFHPHFTGKVLRLHKTSLDAHDDEATGEDELAIAFYDTVVAALVPREFLPELDVVLVDATWLAALELLHDGGRPAERRAKDRIDTARRKGVLATDLVGGDILAIEIKPKWGFLPSPAHLSKETADAKTSTCRFCMHVRFKYKDGDLPTQYCPLDLYSYDEARMKKAICDLWNGWMQSDGALNNMKIFVSGKMIRPSQSSSSLGEFLSTNARVHEAFATALLPFLQTPALRIISNLQRSLDALDIEGLAKLHAMAHPDSTSGLRIGRNPSLEDWQDFVALYRSLYCALDHARPRPENVDTYLIAYLLSATLKDCSMIFRIPRPDALGVSPVNSPRAISIIDLGPKGTDRIEKWARLDREIVAYYRGVVQQKYCVE